MDEQPRERPTGTPWSTALRVVSGIIASLAGLVFVWGSWLTLSSRFGWSDRDVHGYGLLFGTLLAMAAGVVVAITLPPVFPRHRRSRAAALTLAVVGLVVVLLIVAVVTA